MPRAYTDQEKTEALDIWAADGTAEAERQTGISARTITRWANAAGLMSQDRTEKTSDARAAAAERVALEWADYRSREAVSAGALAARAREVIRHALEDDLPNGRNIQSLVTAYGILIDKAEKLSGQASERIEVWSESEVDRELRDAMSALEAKVRADG